MITLSKIARLANVSVSTASKAFAGSGEISEQTREMVFNVAKKHGCFKRFYNAKYPKPVIAIIAPELSSAYYTRYLSLLQTKLESENCELCFSASNFSPECERALLEYYYKHSNVDGIIAIGMHCNPEPDCELPVVFINSSSVTADASVVSNGIGPALSKSVAYLKQRGVTDIGFIGEELTAGKLMLFKSALEEYSIPVRSELIAVTKERFAPGGYLAMQELLDKGIVPRAVICAYDYMAIGAIRCILDNGLKVPENVAVLGMDDIPEAEYLNPPLASIGEPAQELCEAAVQTVLSMINSQPFERNRIVASEFVLRKSFEI